MRLSLWLACFDLVAGSVTGTGLGALRDGTQISKLAEGVYVHIVEADSNAVSNAGFVVLEDGVLVFDTHATPQAGQALLTEINGISSKPVRYIVNSHFHPDHTHGNQAFGQAQQILASTNTRRDILQKDLPAMNRSLGLAQSQLDKMRKDLARERDAGRQASLRSQMRQHQEFLDRMARLKIVHPTITVDDSLSIVDRATEVRLLYLGVGHTSGDVVLFLPKEKIAFLGDLFFNLALPNTQDSVLLEWMTTMEEVLKLDAETFVPGHGPVGTKDQVKGFLTYLKELKALVEPRVARGDSMEQVLRDVELPAKYSSFDFPNFFAANIQKMYTELKALQLSPASAPIRDGTRKVTPNRF